MPSETTDENGYWEQSRRPLTSLLFVLPMLAIYEGSLLLLGDEAARNGADVWLRSLLDLLDFGQYFLLPLLTCGILLGWHHLRHDPWKVSPRVLQGMLIESLVYGFLLLLFARFLYSLFPTLGPTEQTALLLSWATEVGEIAGYFGAGIYEELLFRLIMLPIAIAVLRQIGVSRQWCLVAGVSFTSCLFALAHYQLNVHIGPWHVNMPYGDAFEFYSFSFRFLASVLFCGLYLLRGFGVTAGTHACYDILTVVLS